MSASLATAELAAACAALARGEVIGLPTETVYGLAGDARNPAALARIYALKGRPADHPLIVHLHDAGQVEDWALDAGPAAWALAARFWPGPLTLILRRRPEVLDLVTGGQDSVGLRVPAHPVAQAVLAAFGGGLAAPSANRFGRISPTRAEHVRAEFGAALPIVLDGGASAIGLESTIVDLSGSEPRVLRPGSIGLDLLAGVLGRVPAQQAAAGSPRVSGSLASHYAPATAARLLPRALLETTAAADPQALVLALGSLPPGSRGLALPADATRYGQGLYAALRSLDALGGSAILVEAVPEGADWWAVRDRLRRATF